MPFIYCPVCESPASDQAPYCPKCGHPLAAQPPDRGSPHSPSDEAAMIADQPSDRAGTAHQSPRPTAAEPPRPSEPRSDIELIQEAFRRQQSRPQVVVRPAPLVQTIERTGKKWKALMLIGFLTFLGGLGNCTVSMMAVGASQNAASAGFGALGFLIAIAGLVVLIVGRIGGWWHHG